MLFEMKDVRVAYLLDDEIKQVLSEDEVKAKYELTLRRNNVTINPNSSSLIVFSISGFYDNLNHSLLCYNMTQAVTEYQWMNRNQEWRYGIVTVWEKGGSFGIIGKDKASQYILPGVEKAAEIFANDFLTANPPAK